MKKTRKKLSLPESQIQEVLFELINRISIDGRTMMLSAGICNLSARIWDLRNKKVSIISNKVKDFNKYGREITRVNYSLESKKDASVIYLKLKAKQILRNSQLTKELNLKS